MPTETEQWVRDLAAVIDRINCGVIGRDAAGRIIFVNARLLDWLGYDEQEMLGRQVDEFFPPELREVTRSEVRQAIAGDLRARLTVMQRKDSTTFPILVIPQTYQDENGHFGGIVSAVIDLGTIQTAKRVTGAPTGSLSDGLERIVSQLQSLSLSAGAGTGGGVRLDHPDLAELSRRETEVVARIVGGLRVPSIANELHISPHTVRNHLKSVFRKLGVSTQAELIERVRKLSSRNTRSG